MGREGFLYAGLFLVCSQGAGAGHPSAVPVLGVGGGVVSLEGVVAWQLVVLVLQSSRVRVVWWVVFWRLGSVYLWVWLHRSAVG